MMYKMKLQELCQKRQWALPKYTCMKCGPDHEPRFGASVSVNGTSFDSLVACKSSKQAHNHVAMLAFLHFTSPSDLSATINKPDIGKPNAEENRHSLKVQSDAATFIDDMKFQYKSQLLKYTKQRNLNVPLYSSKSDSAHSSRFKATVRVAERLFESPESFNTLQEAENSAAKFALMSLLIDNFHTASSKDQPGPYKSLLQELAQEEGLSMPVYKTTNSGLPHKPLFSSFLELEGEIFHGEVAKSKKLAELEAARVAYVALKERAASRMAELTSAGLTYDSLQNLEQSKENSGGASRIAELTSTGLTYDSLQNLEQSIENNEADQPDTRSFSAASPQTDKINTSVKPSSCSVETPVSSDIQGLAISPSSAKLDRPNLSTSNPSMRDGSTGASSYLLCNKVRVYRKFPSHALPEGITVLPISDDKWVAVSLEFPNEERNGHY